MKKRDTNKEKGVSRDESSSRGTQIRQEAQESWGSTSLGCRAHLYKCSIPQSVAKSLITYSLHKIDVTVAF